MLDPVWIALIIGVALGALCGVPTALVLLAASAQSETSWQRNDDE